jgi:predicted HTH transcriptional regulator
VKTENWCKPHGHGVIDPFNFTPQTKNPTIAKFFREIGRFEELGSGVRNIFKYTKFYSNGKLPELLEGDIFKITIPIAEIQHYNIRGESVALKDENESLLDIQAKDTVFDAINDAFGNTKSTIVKERLVKMINLIAIKPGCKLIDIQQEIGISKSVLKENIGYLIYSNLIFYSGSKKSGGYFINDCLRSKGNKQTGL